MKAIIGYFNPLFPKIFIGFGSSVARHNVERFSYSYFSLDTKKKIKKFGINLFYFIGMLVSHNVININKCILDIVSFFPIS